MIINRKEKVIATSDTYFNVKLYVTAKHISSFLSDVIISFLGGELTPVELGEILSHSYKSNSKYKDFTIHYEVKK